MKKYPLTKTNKYMTLGIVSLCNGKVQPNLPSMKSLLIFCHWFVINFILQRNSIKFTKQIHSMSGYILSAFVYLVIRSEITSQKFASIVEHYVDNLYFLVPLHNKHLLCLKNIKIISQKVTKLSSLARFFLVC